jgi:transporter family protein
MHPAPWLIYVAVVLLAWGVIGIFQKLATNRISAESTLVWLIVGFILLLPWLYPSGGLFQYSKRALVWGLLSGFLSNLGAWGLFAAMRSGGKAAIVVPMTALYPVVVVILAPFLLHETVTPLQGVGVLSALISVVLLSSQ